MSTLAGRPNRQPGGRLVFRGSLSGRNRFGCRRAGRSRPPTRRTTVRASPGSGTSALSRTSCPAAVPAHGSREPAGGRRTGEALGSGLARIEGDGNSIEKNFSVDESINIAANKLKDRLEIISQERITDEFLKILASPRPSTGLKLLYDSGVMEIIFPEISNLAGVDQRNDYHHKDVFLHTCEVVDNISSKTENVWLSFAALVHDIAKPQTKRFVEGTGWTFHGHEELGARMMKSLFRRMKLPFNKLHYVENLIRLHLRPIALAKDEVTDSAVRRLIVSAEENLEDLIALCRADITSKNPNKVSKYLQNYNNVMQKVIDVKEKDELTAFQSPVKGEIIMEVCNLKPSKKVGEIKKAIEDAILDGKIGNNYEEAYEYLLLIKDEFN